MFLVRHLRHIVIVQAHCPCRPAPAGGVVIRCQVLKSNYFWWWCSRVSGGSRSSQDAGALTDSESEEAVMDWFVDEMAGYEPGDCGSSTDSREMQVFVVKINWLCHSSSLISGASFFPTVTG